MLLYILFLLCNVHAISASKCTLLIYLWQRTYI